jgi:hypothetical protein
MFWKKSPQSDENKGGCLKKRGKIQKETIKKLQKGVQHGEHKIRAGRDDRD